MKQQSNSVLITIIVCATILILGIAAFAFFAFSGKSGDSAEAQDNALAIESNEPASAYPGDLSNPDKRFHSFDWLSNRPLEAADLSGLSAGDLRLLRNAIFAKHGYIFKSDDLKTYFDRFDWYTPKTSKINGLLTRLEQQNANFISKYEGKGTPGTASTTASARPVSVKNVSFANDYSDIVCYTRLTDADVAGLSRAELRILRNTIYARHGRTFTSKDLRDYFNGFSWYNGYRREVPPSELSAIEQHNITLFEKYE